MPVRLAIFVTLLASLCLLLLVDAGSSAPHVAAQSPSGWDPACYLDNTQLDTFLQNTASTYPQIAVLSDAGLSWEGTRHIRVLRLGSGSTSTPRPTLFLLAGQHPRDIATTEVLVRYISYLAQNYGSDPDVTWLLQNRWVYVLPEANPDGYDRVYSQGALQFKNTNNSNGCGDPSSVGTDLNRNYPFNWNSGGTSSNPCDSSYRGPSALSEPESSHVLSAIVGTISPAGLVVSLAAPGPSVLYPWGYSATPPADAAGFASLGWALGRLNGTPRASVHSWNTGGSSLISGILDDSLYGQYSIPAFTMNIGAITEPDCSALDTVWASTRPALLYAAKAVGGDNASTFAHASGPDVTAVSASTVGVPNGSLQMSATISANIGIVAGAVYSVDSPAQDGAGTPLSGNFGGVTATVSAQLDMSTYLPGRHILLVQGESDAGQWGVFASTYFTLTASTPTPLPTLTRTPTRTTTPTFTPTSTPTFTLSPTPSLTRSSTATYSPTSTLTPAPPSTATASPVRTGTVTVSATPLDTATAFAASTTPTSSPSLTETSTSTSTYTSMPTSTATSLAVATYTSTSAPTRTVPAATSTAISTLTATFTAIPPTTNTPTTTATHISTITSTAVRTPTATYTSISLLNSATPTATVQPSRTASATVTALSATNSPTLSPTPILSPSDTPTASDTPTQTGTRTPTNTRTPTDTHTPTDTRTPTNTRTSTDTRTPTNTYTPTNTRTPTDTHTPTNTRTPTDTRTFTPTPIDTPTLTPTRTPTSTRTPTLSPTPLPPDTATPLPCANYSDVHPSQYFYRAVDWLTCRQIVGGYSDGTFRPNNTATRAQIVKMIVFGEGWPLVQPTTPTFGDVGPQDWSYSVVETAASSGIIGGYSDGTFRPNNPVTRGQLCKMIVLARGWALLEPLQPHFSDVPPGSPFYTYIETAQSHAVVSGYGDGTFHPGDEALRGQLSKMLYVALTQP